jgi:hypothetical protein
MFPEFLPIPSGSVTTMRSRRQLDIPKRSIFIRAISGADDGLILQSNVNHPIFNESRKTNPNEPSLYGSKDISGTIGTNWDGTAVNPDVGRGGRPSPIITMFTVREGISQISRVATMNISCYSEQQLNKIQKYFLEPGYTLFIEWGWNTENGKAGTVKVTDVNGKIDTNEILKAASTRGLNNTELNKIRTQSKGDYDCYFGFITGGSVKSEGDVFNVQIEMQGVPSLPTWLQSHNLMFSIDKKTGEATSNNGTDIYSYDETTEIVASQSSSDWDVYAKKRRFKSMFNNLPAQRQTEEVKKLMTTCNSNDFINFDEFVSDEIRKASDATWYEYAAGLVEGRFLNVATKLKGSNDGEIPRTIYANSDRYIRFKLAIDILNANGNIQNYTVGGVGGKTIKVKLQTDDTIIPAFPRMFSTKKDKLIITGQLPDFRKYFDNDTMVDQRTLTDPTWADILAETVDQNHDKEIRFVEQKVTPANLAFKEEPNYWGYINNLYINFDFFKNTINQSNKNIREILTDLLNGMSDAVNSFWNFQIIESKDKKTGELIYKIIDENWSGHPPTSEPFFQHSGATSCFLEANLDIALTAEMSNQIIARRNSIAINPTQPIIDAGDSFFGAHNDKFLAITTDTQLITPTPKNDDRKNYYNDNLAKVTLLPLPHKVNFDRSSIPDGQTSLNVNFGIFTFDDTNYFDVLRNKAFYDYKTKFTKASRTSPLLPIKYSFKTFGISSIERGNTFNIVGIPSTYRINGFFQITDIEHEIVGMTWLTTVTGGYRQYQ